MRFQLLGGGLGLTGEAGVAEVRGRRLRLFLAFLLVHRNEFVSRPRLIDAVWGESPPPGSSHGLDALASRLRRRLGDESRLETGPGGYRLRVEPGELDVDRFEHSLAAGRRLLASGNYELARARLRSGLDEWDGSAFADLVYEPFAAEDAARLEELRLDALEALLEAELGCGDHRAVTAELEGLVAGRPLREHARALLMRALYRSGRQADALDVYRDGYRLLAEQGLEPGAELRNVQTSILRHEPQLVVADRGEPDRPSTKYVRNGDVAIAYQISSDGPYDVLYAPPFVTNVELTWQIPAWAALLRRLGSFCRLIRFDKRGTGMSDRVAVGDLETTVEDVRAVMDASLSREAAIIGASDAGPLALLFTAAHPDRVWALVLWGATARTAWSEDYPIGIRELEFEQSIAEDERIWTDPGYAESLARALGAADVTELAAMWRQSASPGAIRAIERQALEVDVRDVLPQISVPTLVLNRDGDDAVSTGSRYLAEHLPNARHIEFPGSEHVMFAGGDGDSEPILRELETFLGGAWAARA